MGCDDEEPGRATSVNDGLDQRKDAVSTPRFVCGRADGLTFLPLVSQITDIKKKNAALQHLRTVAGTFGSILVSGCGKWKKFQARFPLPGGNTDAFLLAVCDSLAKSAATAKIKPASLKMHEAGKPHFIAFYSGCSSSAMGYLSFFF